MDTVLRPIKRFLCPVDLSSHSGEALRYAAALRSVMDGELTVLFVRPHADDAGRRADGALGAFAADALGAETPVQLLERHGDAVSEILAAAADTAADVIVMGTHGRSGLQRLLVGSVTERVVRRASVPVLTVPLRAKMETPETVRPGTVLCAVDFSEPSACAIEYAASIVAAAGGRLVLTHALEWSEESDTLPASAEESLPSSEDDAVATMRGLLSDEMRQRCAPEFVVAYGDPADELVRVAHEYEAGLIVLGVRRRNPIDMALFGSTAQRLIRDGVRPVLTVRAPAHS